MELISIWYLSSLKQLVCSERASEVSVVLQRRFRWVFPGPFSLGNCTVNCTIQTEGILRGKAAFNSLMSCRSVSFEFSFWEGKTRFTHADAVNKRANSHNFKIKKNTFRKIIDCFLRKYCRGSPRQSSFAFFSKSVLAHFFFFWRALIDRCRIATDTCKNNVSKFVGGLLNQLYYLADKNVSVKPLS